LLRAVSVSNGQNPEARIWIVTFVSCLLLSSNLLIFLPSDLLSCFLFTLSSLLFPPHALRLTLCTTWLAVALSPSTSLRTLSLSKGLSKGRRRLFFAQCTCPLEPLDPNLLLYVVNNQTKQKIFPFILPSKKDELFFYQNIATHRSVEFLKSSVDG